MVRHPWDVQAPDAPVRLFCLPWAGGSAVFYQRAWQREFAPDVDVRPLELPGRGIESDEKLLRRVDDLVDFLLDRLTPLLDRPYALFGHSMGALLSLELTRRLAAEGYPAPVRLFQSGSGIPGRRHRTTGRALHTLPENEFREWLRTTGGTPAAVFQNPELLDHLSPLLRADFELCDVYRERGGAPLSCPVTAIGGDADPYVPVEALSEWSEVTTGPCELMVLSGGHFAFQDHLDRVRSYVAAALRTATAGLTH
ncbi:thioesterase II family protein [Streptomyces physcomitrii]|uniref:Thioesterase n=1 Tax=Streptomyces physcomitrii TaxID=2724184 RepID=A0ABX1H9C8_9ACTN|nr:alpha/beta fold hydrolase [Streptomyces physcomitrii]NKI43875.1 thioesterase [Streptomyces physcomitrii]